MHRMQLDYLCFTVFALWMQILLLPRWTEGLSCYSCDSKNDEGCKNDDLKSGHRSNMFSKKCAGSDAACIKSSLAVRDYYEEHYGKADMKKYYAAMDKAAECREVGVPHGPAVTIPSGGDGVTTASAGGSPEVTAAPDAAGPEAEGSGTEAGVAAVAVTEAAEGADVKRRRRAVAANCPPYPAQFPEPQAVVSRSDKRWVYGCTNRSQWSALGITHCHTHSDGIVLRTVCLCAEDLCNAAPAPGALSFLVLAAALLHLRGALG